MKSAALRHLPIFDQSAQYSGARNALLAAERGLRRQTDHVAAQGVDVVYIPEPLTEGVRGKWLNLWNLNGDGTFLATLVDEGLRFTAHCGGPNEIYP